jgi:uncharacterized protein (TIGR03435 family)
MATIKAKTAAILLTAIALAAATVLLIKVENRRHSMWRVANPNPALLRTTPAQVSLLPTKFVWGGGWTRDGDNMIGIGVQLESVIEAAYDMPGSRIVFTTGLPPIRYDFISNLGRRSTDALQKEINRATGLQVHRVMREMDVLLLTQSSHSGPDLKPAVETAGASTYYRNGSGFWVHQPLSTLAQALERYLHTPVLDETELTGAFDYNLKLTWPPDPDAVKRNLSDLLGLRLETGKRRIEVVVVDRVTN